MSLRTGTSYDEPEIQGIPTGLFVAGFLANCAMLPVDAAVNERILKRRSFAHFRFVDDHTILAYEFEELCDWIEKYQAMLTEYDTGASVNTEKYDPVSLRDWINVRADPSETSRTFSEQELSEINELRVFAVNDTRFDGANPTKLLTKTLGQVSAIATADIEILDDGELEERLKQLEWLLLADISEREIRPDTRAAFAAGKIAALAPLLIHETDDLVDSFRALQALKAQAPEPSRSTKEEIDQYAATIERHNRSVANLQVKFKQEEWRRLNHCFGLLLQAFREFPEKARLFYRLHEYCRITGFKGLNRIADWIVEARKRQHDAWACYYSGLSLQILARGVLSAARELGMEHALLSDKEAALSHLEDVSKIDVSAHLMPRQQEAWFHAIGRREFGVALLSASEVVRQTIDTDSLSFDLQSLANKCVKLSFDGPVLTWTHETGRCAGVWAHYCESILSIDEVPSPVWKRFAPLFVFANDSDRYAARRYPEHLSDEGWRHILHSEESIPKADSGWIRDAIEGKKQRIDAALSSKIVALKRAGRSLTAPVEGWITLASWTRQVSKEVSPFDPRRSEWTALEVVRQIISPIIDEFDADRSRLDRLHPNNVLVPESWKSKFSYTHQRAGVSWEAWQSFARCNVVMLRALPTSVTDYRYFTHLSGGRRLEDWERQLVGVGRLLLGLLRLNHDVLRIWNIRGNEHVFQLPRTRWFQSLAVSSPTLLILEACLGGRSAETRAIARSPGLFGWTNGLKTNDTDFDPPSLLDPNELLSALVSAQNILKDNQLSVAMNQPRQLIPFRLNDFAAGSNVATVADDFDE